MAKPTTPVTGVPAEHDKNGKACMLGRVALAKVDQLVRRFDEHVRRFDDHLNSDLTRLQQITEDINGLRHEDVSGLRDEIHDTNKHVADVRVNMAMALSGLEAINKILTEQQSERHVKMVAETKTDTASRLAVIDDVTDAKKTKRKFWLHVALALLGLACTGLGVLIERYR